MNTIQLLNRIRETSSAIDALNNELLAANTGPSRLERDLLKSRCVELYDLILALDAVAQEQAPRKEVKPVEQKREEKTPEPVKEEPAPVDPHMSMESFEIRELEAISNLPPNPVPVVPPPSMPDAPVLFPDPVTVKRDDTVHHEMSLHEKISSGIRKTDVNERVNARVESLKSAINLNRKIAFVNELFGENTVEYAKAIDRLNAAGGLTEAMRIFNELKHQYAWSNEHELVKDLEALIQKRYA